MSDWHGETPFYLIIQTPDENVGIDLDEYQWMEKYRAYLRVPGTWNLVHKETHRVVFTVAVHEGDQPYYAARHVGVTGSAGGNEITTYGIGKKLPDGTTERLWILPNGVVCGGDDVGELGVVLLKEMGPR